MELLLLLALWGLSVRLMRACSLPPIWSVVGAGLVALLFYPVVVQVLLDAYTEVSSLPTFWLLAGCVVLITVGSLGYWLGRSGFPDRHPPASPPRR
jgi:hypothetical protein